MTIYERLLPLEPVLAGPWRWLAFVAVLLPLAATAWAVFGARWRPDGVLRCPRCQHAFAPGTRFGSVEGAHCTECGASVASERAALARRGRGALVAGGILASAALAAPLLAWHSGHVFLARTLLPRWVEVGRAQFGNGLVVSHEVDPVQHFLGWTPNPREGSGQGRFHDAPAAGDDGAAGARWPDRMRVVAWMAATPGAPAAFASMGPVIFGADPASSEEAPERMPAEGSPGWGGDITGDAGPDAVFGQPNIGSGGGILWFSIVPPGNEGGAPAIVEVGNGRFLKDPVRGDWVFDRDCHGFRYALVPGYYLRDPSVPCAWDQVRGEWRADIARMRRAVDHAALGRHASGAAAAWEQCAAAAPRAQGGASPVGECPGMLHHLVEGALEFVATGHGVGWQPWVESAWPGSAPRSLRDRFIADFRAALERCECSAALRELNAGSLDAAPPREATVPAGASAR